MAWRRALVILAAAAAGVLLVANPAAADTDLTLNPDHQDETAAGFNQDCTAPFSSNMTEDGWHFLWPKGGDFTSLTATFTNGGAPFDVTVTSTDAGSQSGNGTTWHGYIDDTGSGDFKHVYLFTQPGWTLVDATGTRVDGETTGDNLTQFNLSHTCAAKTSSPSPSPSASPSPSPTTSASPGTSGSTDPGTPGTTPPGDDRLPTTGVALTGLVAAGIGLILGGAALLFLRRRRDQPTA